MKGCIFTLLILLCFLQLNCGYQEKKVQELSIFKEEVRAASESSAYTPGELIVKLKPDAFNQKGELISESIKALNTTYGLISMEPLFRGKSSSEIRYIYKLKFPDNIDVMELVNQYNKDPSVVYAEPNYIVHLMNKDS